MAADLPEPDLAVLREEYVLVQSWKKTASYIRHHNWFADTLELDRVTVNLPSFLAELRGLLEHPSRWHNDPLRIVPAPKSQRWRISADSTRWEPAKARSLGEKLRPLAHASLKDQVIATALMLCLANRVETIQGNPNSDLKNPQSRRNVVSYGNRLFCDTIGQELHHRWGSAKLYRGYFQDYRRFLSRPEIVAETVSGVPGRRTLIVHSDLRQFYDRVRPQSLQRQINALRRKNDDPRFYALARRVLNWDWDRRDSREVDMYARQSGITGFSRVALPQGLVASGFFANVTLLAFDQGLRDSLNQEIEPGVRLEDACRYVDNLRLVLSVDSGLSLIDAERIAGKFLAKLLGRHATGLSVSEEKTVAAAYGGDERPLVRQSRKMARIQAAVSGGFDALGGAEILDAVQGLIRSQERYSKERVEKENWRLLPVPDAADPTVARFAAGRFRRTFRSLRPLLPDVDESAQGSEEEGATERELLRQRPIKVRAEIDDEVRAFALGLIEAWLEDPSNVRLLRIGLDLWPAEDLLKNVLELLRPFTQYGGRRTAGRRVAWYCLPEVFRAAATETGLVWDEDSLPGKVNVDRYRSILQEEGLRLMSLEASLPWYLNQQVLLFMATTDFAGGPPGNTRRRPQVRHYWELIRYLNGFTEALPDSDFATLAILSRRCFRSKHTTLDRIVDRINVRRFEEIAMRDPPFALEVLELRQDIADQLSPRLREDLCIDRTVKAEGEGWASLSEIVLHKEVPNPLRNEIALLNFASKFLEAWQRHSSAEAITPANVWLKIGDDAGPTKRVEELRIIPSRADSSGSIYKVPYWCEPTERWRFQLGYLLRFVLSAQPDFTRVVRPFYRAERTNSYREAVSHWYQRLYGLFNAHSAFGDDWLPISEWIEQLLFALLNWPGCRSSDALAWVKEGVEKTRSMIDARFQWLVQKQGQSDGILIIPISAPRPGAAVARPLRACIVQTVIPSPADFDKNDPTCSASLIRRRHRNHLSAAIAAIERMLYLRETHNGREGRLDWLILPELSVHPDDVFTHLVPFARAHKTIILAGVTYQEILQNQPLVNSAIWIIPVWSPTRGLQVLTRRQGKQYLSLQETKWNSPTNVLQWLQTLSVAGRLRMVSEQ